MAFIKICHECGSINLTYDEQRGEVICNDCGLVVEEKMVDTGQEIQSQFDKSDKKGRGGAPLSMQKFDKGLTTNVGEISDIYKRGALRLNLTARNCTQSDCSDGNWQDIIKQETLALELIQKETADIEVNIDEVNIKIGLEKTS